MFKYYFTEAVRPSLCLSEFASNQLLEQKRRRILGLMEHNEMMLENEITDLQPQNIVSNLKRKVWRDCTDQDSSEEESVGEVMRRIKRIKFPVYITVKSLNGESITLDLDYNDTIDRLKQTLHERVGIPPLNQKLIFGGKQIKDDQTVQSYGMVNGSVVYLVLALPHRHGFSGISSEHRISQ